MTFTDVAYVTFTDVANVTFTDVAYVTFTDVANVTFTDVAYVTYVFQKAKRKIKISENRLMKHVTKQKKNKTHT